MQAVCVPSGFQRKDSCNIKGVLHPLTRNNHVFLLYFKIIIIIIVDICYAPVSAWRCSWHRPLLLPFHYQEIIRTISLLIRLFAASGQLLAQTYEHLDCDIETSTQCAWVDEASEVKWFAQVHNTLAVAGLDLTTFRLWVLRCSTRPHVPSISKLSPFWKIIYAFYSKLS